MLKKIKTLLFKAATAILAAITLIIDDCLLIAGIVFLYLGTTAIYPPAGQITLGLCLIGLAFLFAHRKIKP